MQTYEVDDILKYVEECNYIKGKIDQCIEIRRAIVERKLRLFEEWDGMLRKERLAQLGRFLTSYEAMFKRERHIIWFFRRGIDSAIRILTGLESCAGVFGDEIRRTLAACNELELAIGRYEKRMGKEEKMLHETERERLQVELIGKFYKMLKEEVGTDLQLVSRLKSNIREIAALKESIDAKLQRNAIVKRFCGQLTPNLGMVALYRWAPVAIELAKNPAMLVNGSIVNTTQFEEATAGIVLACLGISMTARMINALIPSLDTEEKKLLGELTTSETLKNMKEDILKFRA